MRIVGKDAMFRDGENSCSVGELKCVNVRVMLWDTKNGGRCICGRSCLELHEDSGLEGKGRRTMWVD